MSESGKTESNGNLNHHHGGAGTGQGGDSVQQQLKGGADLGRQVSITLTPSQFEEMYLQPGVKSRGQSENIKTFGNPTPLGIVCFLLTYSPTMSILMGFRGTTSNSLLSLMCVLLAAASSAKCCLEHRTSIPAYLVFLCPSAVASTI
jgi:hypothetical protein